MSEQPREAPKVYTVYLPPNHPFAKMSLQEFEALWGANIGRQIVQPIPRA